MTGGWTEHRLLTAIGEVCNGSINEADAAALDALLCSDAQARRIYVNYMWLHGGLYEEAGSLGGVGNSDVADVGHSGSAPRVVRSFANPSPSPSVRGRGMWLWIAAALVGVIAGTNWLTWQWSGGRQVAAVGGVAEKEPTVARITGAHNCIWKDPLAAGFGAKLGAGQVVELREGLAEITFNDGATVLLEGPASFTVDAADRGGLHAGRLAAVVPHRARAFRVRTASLEVFDVDAEFGLLAQESGAAEVHVFNGLVRAKVLGDDGRATRQLELNAAQAARINPASTTVLEFPADDAKFVRNIQPAAGPHDGLLAYEGFRYPGGPLEAQNGGFGWAGPWFTTSAEAEAGPDSNRVQPGSLAAEGLVPAGNRAMIAAQYNRIRRQLATSVGGVFDAEGLVENLDELRLIGRDGKQIYVSFLQRASKTADGFYGIEFHRGDGNANRVLCIGNGADGAGYGVTSNVNVYGDKNLPTLGEETTEVNFFVVKFTFGVANRDTVEVYRNPASLRDESVCTPDAVLRGNFAFDRISLANFDGSKTLEADEIRVGGHFLAVTGRWGHNGSRLIEQLTRGGSRPAASGWRPCDFYQWLTAESRQPLAFSVPCSKRGPVSREVAS